MSTRKRIPTIVEATGTVRKTITLPPDVALTGKARAKAEGRKFANYVAWLIRRDAEGGAA